MESKTTIHTLLRGTEIHVPEYQRAYSWDSDMTASDSAAISSKQVAVFLNDIMDYISNNVFMPLVALGTCILFGWVAKPKTIIDEVTKNGEKFNRKFIYNVTIKFVAPALLVVLFAQAIGLFSF